MKKLPEIKKTIKSFILEEDAKVLDKTMLKISLAISFAAFTTLSHIQDANAKGHKDHLNHENKLYDKSIDPNLQNNNEKETITRQFTAKGQTLKVDVPPKSIGAAHGNHYNHNNNNKK